LEAYLGDFEVSRDYRIVTDERCKAGIYIQGFSQASHERHLAVGAADSGG
jgi:L-ornithine N5-oxygenase